MNITSKRLVCLQCNKDLQGYQTKFCCCSCAAKYNNTHRVLTTKGKKKKTTCSNCGKVIEIGINAQLSGHLCKECIKRRKFNQFGRCKFCGDVNPRFQRSLYCSEQCKHDFKYINVLAKYFSIDKSKIGSQEIVDEINKIREWLYNEYWIEEKTSSEICKEIGYPAQNFTAKLLKNLGIKARNLSQAASLNHLKSSLCIDTSGLHYKHGWHSTWDNNEVYLRSSYEFEYAEQLDSNKIHYEVEGLRIKYFDSQKNDYKCAIPDFYIPSINTIVEIKSTYTLDLQNMKDKFRSYQELGYKTRLILDHKEVDINTLTNRGQGWLLQ